MWNGTMFVDLDWPLNASSPLSASAELLVLTVCYSGKLVVYMLNMFRWILMPSTSRWWKSCSFCQ